MVNYLYRCDERHETTEPAPIGYAPASVDCACGRIARRAMTSPMLSTMGKIHRQAVDTAAGSAENPAVVSQPPPARRPQPRSTDPRHARLPRP